MNDDPLVKALEGQWHKVLALVLRKLGVATVELNSTDLVIPPEGLNVVAHERAASLEIRLVADAEAAALRQRRARELRFIAS